MDIFFIITQVIMNRAILLMCFVEINLQELAMYSEAVMCIDHIGLLVLDVYCVLVYIFFSAYWVVRNVALKKVVADLRNGISLLLLLVLSYCFFRVVRLLWTVWNLGVVNRCFDQTVCSFLVAEPCPSLLLQRHMAELLNQDKEMAASFLNSVLNQLNWAFSEFIGMIQEVRESVNPFVTLCHEL